MTTSEFSTLEKGSIVRRGQENTFYKVMIIAKNGYAICTPGVKIKHTRSKALIGPGNLDKWCLVHPDEIPFWELRGDI